MSEQEKQLARVGGNVGPIVKDFCRKVLAKPVPTFTGSELRDFVVNVHGKLAPGSADRVLRMLRRAGELDYVVVNRTAGLYKVLSVSAEIKSK
jgi:hypothetical protein